MSVERTDTGHARHLKLPFFILILVLVLVAFAAYFRALSVAATTLRRWTATAAAATAAATAAPAAPAAVEEEELSQRAGLERQDIRRPMQRHQHVEQQRPMRRPRGTEAPARSKEQSSAALGSQEVSQGAFLSCTRLCAR